MSSTALSLMQASERRRTLILQAAGVKFCGRNGILGWLQPLRHPRRLTEASGKRFTEPIATPGEHGGSDVLLGVQTRLLHQRRYKIEEFRARFWQAQGTPGFAAALLCGDYSAKPPMHPSLLRRSG
jgi:hypothetical protein